MKDSLTSNNYRDFRQRYEGVFGFFSPEGKKPLLVQLSSVEETKVNFIDVLGVNYHVNVNSGIPFDFLPIERKVVNIIGDDILYACRKPARQWQRGVCSANTSITSLCVPTRRIGFGFNLVSAVWDTPVPYSTAIEEFSYGVRKNVALDSRFSIIGDKVHLYNTPIGSYVSGTLQIIPLFKQEVSDTVFRNNLKFKVEVTNG
jgi:hypothetical protein